MGDKTQLATLLLSAQSSSPWIVFVGAALALIATSLVGVLLGYWLSKRLTPKNSRFIPFSITVIGSRIINYGCY